MLSKLDDFLVERHDLTNRTKLQYRMAFKALSKYVDDPFGLNKKDLDAALS